MRGSCDHCGLRRILNPCPCPVCAEAPPQARPRLCADCERKELLAQLHEVGCHAITETSNRCNTVNVQVAMGAPQ